MVTFLVDSDKSLIRTSQEDVYQHQVSGFIDFIVNPELAEDLLDYRVVAQFYYPYHFNEAGYNVRYIEFSLKFEPQLNDDGYYEMLLPITDIITEKVGTLKVALEFTHIDTKQEIKTNIATLPIYYDEESKTDVSGDEEVEWIGWEVL